jgi:hypothetical protein
MKNVPLLLPDPSYAELLEVVLVVTGITESKGSPALLLTASAMPL